MGIAFAATDCTRCGTTRLLVAGCENCGAPARKNAVDHNVVRRTERVRQVDASAAARGREQGGAALDPTATMITFTDALVSGLTAIETQSSSEWARHGLPQLAGALRQLGELASQLAASAGQRPTSLPRAYLRVVGDLIGLWPTYREALTTTDVRLAQELATRGQRTLDGALVPLQEAVNARVEAEIFADADAEPSLTRRAVAGFVRRYGHSELDDTFNSATVEAEQTLETRVPVPQAVSFAVLLIIADAHLDRELFIKKSKLSLEVISAGHVDRVINDSLVRDDLATSAERLMEAIAAFEASTATATSAKAFARRFVRLYADVYENVAGPLFAAARCILAETSRDGYEGELLRDATENAKWVRKRIDAPESETQRLLRHSGSHAGGSRVSPDGDKVVLNLRATKGWTLEARTRSTEEISDALLELLETLLALEWAITTSLLMRGEEIVPSSEALSRLGLDSRDVASVLIEAAAKRYGAKVTSGGTHWVVEGELGKGDALALAHSTLAAFPADVSVIRVGAPKAARVAAVSFDALDRALASASTARTPLEGAVTMTSLAAALTVGDQAGLSEAAVLGLANTIAFSPDEARMTKARLLRSLMALSDGLGFEDGATRCKVALRGLRQDNLQELERAIQRDPRKEPVVMPEFDALIVER